jgi:hypothetical protein
VSLAFIFRCPGPFFTNELLESGKFATYDARQVAEGYCPDGWHTSLEAAIDEAGRAKPAPAPEPPAVDVVDALDDTQPTRDELEKEAERLGIKVDKRWGDKRLMQEVVKALEGTGD